MGDMADHIAYANEGYSEEELAGIGHNSDGDDDGRTAVQGKPENVAAEQLRSFIERIENLEEEKKAIADDIKEVFAEAKGHGFDPKIMRQVLKIRKMDSSEREEQEALISLYLQALGI